MILLGSSQSNACVRRLLVLRSEPADCACCCLARIDPSVGSSAVAKPFCATICRTLAVRCSPVEVW